MRIGIGSYIPGSSCVHACDVRVKLVLLAAYSVAVFAAGTEAGLAACIVALVCVVAATRVPVGRFLRPLAPVFGIAAFAAVCSGFSFDVASAPSEGLLSFLPPIVLAGTFGFVPAAFEHGCFLAVRVMAPAVASLAVTYTSSSTELVDGLRALLRPLRRLGAPVDDAAMVLSIALRFIPVMSDEFDRVRSAQASRGAAFHTGGLKARLEAYRTAFVPLFVGVFRRADALALAMDARCYGVPGVRRSMRMRPLAARDVAACAAGLAVCAAAALLR